MADSVGEVDLRLRNADLSDRDQILRWRNDPMTVSASLTQRPVSSQEHQQWFERVLRDSTRVLLIASRGDEDVGSVRFDQHPDGWEINVSVDSRHRGRGIGGALIRLATDALRVEKGNVQVLARVRSENVVSQRAFLRAGYVLSDAQNKVIVFISTPPL